MDAAAVDKLCETGDEPLMVDACGVSYQCHSVRCLWHTGVWARHVFVTARGTHVIVRAWKPLDGAWKTTRTALPADKHRPSYRPRSGWGYVAPHANQRFSAADLLYLVRKPASFSPPGRLRCRQRDLDSPIGVDNVVLLKQRDREPENWGSNADADTPTWCPVPFVRTDVSIPRGLRWANAHRPQSSPGHAWGSGADLTVAEVKRVAKYVEHTDEYCFGVDACTGETASELLKQDSSLQTRQLMKHMQSPGQRSQRALHHLAVRVKCFLSIQAGGAPMQHA